MHSQVQKITAKGTMFKSFQNSAGFPCGSPGKESACNAGDLGSILGFGRSPGEGKGYPFQYSGLEYSMDCIVHGVAEQDKTERLSFHFTSKLKSRKQSLDGNLSLSFSFFFFLVFNTKFSKVLESIFFFPSYSRLNSETSPYRRFFVFFFLTHKQVPVFYNAHIPLFLNSLIKNKSSFVRIVPPETKSCFCLYTFLL